MKIMHLKAALLVSAFFIPSTASAEDIQPLKYEDFANYYIAKHEGLSEEKDFAVNYMKFAHCDEYAKSQKSEFAKRRLQSQIDEKMAAFKQQEVALPKRVQVVLDTSFGKYDFDKKAFGFKPIKEGMYIPIKPGKTNSACTIYSGTWPGQFELHFTNGQIFNHIPVPEDKAEQLNLEKYSRRGRVEMIVEIEGMKMEDAKMVSDGKTVQMKNPSSVIKGRIVQMDAYVRYVQRYMSKRPTKGPLVGSFNEAEIAKLEAVHLAEMKEKPLDFSPKVFAAWADNLEGVGLVQKHNFDTSDIVAYNPIRLVDVKDIHGIVGKDNKTMKITTPGYNTSAPERFSYNSPMGKITLLITNMDDYFGEHALSAEDTAFLSDDSVTRARRMNFYLMPKDYEVLESDGKEEKVMEVEMQKIEFEHQDVFAGKMLRTITIQN